MTKPSAEPHDAPARHGDAIDLALSNEATLILPQPQQRSESDGSGAIPEPDLRSTLRLQKAAIESAANAIFITDRSGIIEWANPGFEVLTGYRVAEVIGRNPAALKSGEHDAQYYHDLWRTILSGDVWRARVTNRHKSGSLYTAEQTITPIFDDTGIITHFVAIHEDITARLESEQRMAHMALHDSLTKLPNRYALESRLDIELARANRLGSRVALMFIDLDNFKDVNDTFGHSVGDQLLVAVGRRLQERLRDVDHISRLGGDEFAVVQSDVSSTRSATRLAQRLLEAFTGGFHVGGREILANASIGVSISDRGAGSTSIILQQADLALYRAKAEGRARVRLFEDEMDIEMRRRVALAHGLRRAVEDGELFLLYQPQVSLGESRIIGIEALPRWQHPSLGVVGPMEFVAIAESSGLIDRIGEWVLRTACEQAKNWQDRDLPPLPVAVHVSAVQLRDPHFVELVAGILATTGLDPRYLELELTESALNMARQHEEEALLALDRLGVGIALDGFGRGYASLDYLRRYPLSKVKLDQSFVCDMETDTKKAAIVNAVIDLAAKLGLHVVAEGAEPADQLQRSIQAGCREAHGFSFSRPVSAGDLEELLTAGSDHVHGHGASR